jgi:hypothetical protein
MFKVRLRAATASCALIVGLSGFIHDFQVLQVMRKTKKNFSEIKAALPQVE